MKPRVASFITVLAWIASSSFLNAQGNDFSCRQGRENRPVTAVLWNKFSVSIRYASEDVEYRCRIELHDPSGKSVLALDGINTELRMPEGRDLDNDGLPDILLGADVGGGNRCCWEYSIVSFSRSHTSST